MRMYTHVKHKTTQTNTNELYSHRCIHECFERTFVPNHIGISSIPLRGILVKCLNQEARTNRIVVSEFKSLNLKDPIESKYTKRYLMFYICHSKHTKTNIPHLNLIRQFGTFAYENSK